MATPSSECLKHSRIVEIDGRSDTFDLCDRDLWPFETKISAKPRYLEISMRSKFGDSIQ